MGFRYVIIELEDSYYADAVVSEIALYNQRGGKINYTTTESGAYDSTQGTTPRYWNHREFWNRNNLNDGEIAVDSSSSTILLSDGTSPAPRNGWARFFLDLGKEEEVSKVEFWNGSEYSVYQKRHAKIVRIFTTNNNPTDYITSNRLTDNNLILRCEITLPPNIDRALRIVGNFAAVTYKFLFLKNNTAYTIENNTLKSLGTITTANASTLFKSGIEAITKEHCVLVGQQLGKAKILKMLV